MNEPRAHRRLSAILATDVAGYSRLMAEDEAGTLTMLRDLWCHRFDPTVAEHHGRIVKMMGDGALVEFSSAVDAVDCAIAIQHAMADHNGTKIGQKAMELRIGINLGDIIIDGDDIFGDGVNVAVRLEGQAPIAGFLMSEAVYAQIKGKISARFIEVGELHLKNIAAPVRAWSWGGESIMKSAVALMPEHGTGGTPLVTVRPVMDTTPFAFGPFVFDYKLSSLQRDGSPVMLGQHALALLEILLTAHGEIVDRKPLMEGAWVGEVVEDADLTKQMSALCQTLGVASDGKGWIETIAQRGYRLKQSAEPIVRPSPDLNRRRRLAVLPFDNLSGDPQQDHVADSLVEDITTELSSLQSIAVIARTSSFAYRGRAMDVRTLGQELGADYVLEGSVRRIGENLRVTAQLVDAKSGAHVWARHFDCGRGELFDTQDRIVERVVFEIEPQIRRTEIMLARNKPPESLTAYELVAQATSLCWSDIRRNNAEAYSLFRRALDIDPTSGNALCRASQALSLRQAWGWGTLSEADRIDCLEFCWRAMDEAPDDGVVLAICANSLITIGRQYDLGLDVMSNALLLNSNHVGVQIQAGFAELRCGSLERSMDCFLRAIAMTTQGVIFLNSAYYGVAEVTMSSGDYAEARRMAEQAVVLNRKHDCPYWILISANALLGRMDEARGWLSIFRELSPDVTVTSLRMGQVFKFPERFQPILKGLQLAGLPEA